MHMTFVDEIPILVAVIALLGVILAGFITNWVDQKHHAREVLLKPAEEYARGALDSLAKLRYVTPPKWVLANEVPHRNE